VVQQKGLPCNCSSVDPIILLRWSSAVEAIASYADVAVWWIKGLVTKRPLKLHPTWSDVNENMASFDRTAVLQLLPHRYGDRQ